MSVEAQPQRFRVGYVALVGRPNAGKSTLLNRLIRERLAMMSPRPQATRHKILGIASGEDHQTLFLDTPGWMERARDLLDERMRQRVSEALADADVVVLLAEARPPGRIEEALLAAARARGRPVLVAVNKVDAAPRGAVEEAVAAYRARPDVAAVYAVSALTGEGVEDLAGAIRERLPPGEPLFPPDQLTDVTERFLVAEIIREKVYELYADEVPYETAVEIEEFREARPEEERKKDYIRAVLYVYRDSQKGILIGKGGERLRRLGEAARRDVEALLGRPVFLEFRIKVRPRWRKDPGFLRRLGY